MEVPKALRVHSLGHCFFCLKKVHKKVGAHQGTYHSLRNLSFWFGGFLRFNILKTREEVSKNAARNDLQVELCGRCEEYKKRIDEYVRQLEEAVCRVQLTAGVIKELIEKADDADLTQSTVDCITDDPEQYKAFSQDVLESARKEIVRKCNIELERDFSKKDFTAIKDLMGYDDYVPINAAGIKIEPESAVVKIEKEEADFSADEEFSASSRVYELPVPILERNECTNAHISATVKTEKDVSILPICKSVYTQTEAYVPDNNEAPKPNSLCEPTNTTSVEDTNSLNPSVPTDTDIIMENPAASYNVSSPTNKGTMEEEQATSSTSGGGHLSPRHPHQSTGQHQGSLDEATPNLAAPVSKQSTKKPLHSAILRRSSQRNGTATAGPSQNNASPTSLAGIKMVHKIPNPGATLQYQCTFCSKQFKKAFHAKRHYEVVHLKIKRHSCKICNRKFTYAYQLRQHFNKCSEGRENARNGVKGFLCDICPKAFCDKYVLEKHKKAVHLKMNYVACDLCGKRFQSKTGLQEHKDSVHFGIISECVKPCEAKYKHKSDLRKHQKYCQIFQLYSVNWFV